LADGLTLLFSGAAIATERLARVQAAGVAERMGNRELAESILESLALDKLVEADDEEAEAAMHNIADLLIFAHAWVKARLDVVTK
jgi:hypothetical protein